MATIKYLNMVETKKYTDGERDWNATKKFVGLDLYGEKGARFLANVIGYIYDGTYLNRMGTTIGGGLFAQCSCSVVIDAKGQVGILFNRYDRVYKYVRIARGETEKLKSIKDKLANEVKKFWNELAMTHHLLEINVVTNIDKAGDVSTQEEKINWNEYRYLYEILKSRDPKKIEKKYGTKAKDAMIGKKIEDQFVLASLETMDAEFDRICKEEEEEMKSLQKKHNEEYTEMRYRQEEEKKASIQKYKAMKDNIEQQRNMIKEGAFAA